MSEIVTYTFLPWLRQGLANSSGQVGNPFSDLYGSMQMMWRDVRYAPMRPPTSRDAVTLELKPRR